MADNVTTPLTGSGDSTAVVATDNIGGVNYQRVKVTTGADGTANDVSSSNPMPVDASGTAVPVTDNAGSLTVDQSTASSLQTTVTPSGTGIIGVSATSANTTVKTNWTGNSVYSATAVSATVLTVSSAAGSFHGGMFINVASTVAYIQVFDTTGAVTLGATTPTFVIPIPVNATAANGAAFVAEFPRGITISNGIKVAATTTPAGSTGLSAALTGFFLYR